MEALLVCNYATGRKRSPKTSKAAQQEEISLRPVQASTFEGRHQVLRFQKNQESAPHRYNQ
jgi:hypothetical protein